MRLLRSSAVVGGFTLFSRFFGMVRDTLLAVRLGAGPVTDAFFVALQFPNLFRRIFAEGAFSSAFVPLYVRRMEAEGVDEANSFAAEVLSILATAVLGLVVIAQIFMPWLMVLLGPGFINDLDLFAAAVMMTQITMPYLLCMSIAAMISGTLNSHGRFVTAAAAPILLNVVLVSMLLWTPGPRQDLALYLSAGVTFSGILQAAWLYLAARRAGIALTLRAPRLTESVKRLFVLAVPGVAAASATHINQLIAGSIATLQEGARSWIYYAERLYQLPLGVIGIAMGVALLPALSMRLRVGDKVGAMGALNRAIEVSMALTLPAAAALLVVPDTVVEGLFQRGAFEAADTQRTVLALMIYAAGLPAFVLIKVFSPVFFAREDTMTPMKFAAGSIAVNTVLGVILFFGAMQFAGLALATSLAGWLNAVLLGTTLARRGQWVIDDRLLHRLPRILGACMVMALGLWLIDVYAAQPAQLWIGARISADFASILWMAASVVGGMGIYGLAILALGGLQPREVFSLIRRDGAAAPEPAVKVDA